MITQVVTITNRPSPFADGVMPIGFAVAFVIAIASILIIRRHL